MIHVYSFKEEWSPEMDGLLGYYYETKEDAVNRLLENGYKYEEEDGWYVNDYSVVNVIKFKNYKEKLKK